MKKVWNDAILEELNIAATASGPEKSDEPDSIVYHSEAEGWVAKYGKPALSASPLN